jgi:hypothetical protein
MGLRKMIRESAFNMARRDLALFLGDHEEDLLRVFREEIQRLDDEIPEERYFIDIKMVPLGEMVIKAALRAMRRFLTEDPATLELVADADNSGSYKLKPKSE